MLAASSSRHSSLPLTLTNLVGREREIAATCALLTRPEVRLVTLTGPGGVGKTRLALAVAEQLADAFPDGIAFVSLAAIRDPGLVPAAIAQSLDVREAGRQSIVESIAAAIGEQQVLLVLDNFEQVLEAASVVNDLLVACPRLTVLVTSRAVLHLLAEHNVTVEPLALADPERLPAYEQLVEVESIRLFSERVRAARSDFALTEANAPLIAAICARLDGLPLAIYLAAARVRLLSPSALLANLEQRLHLLSGGPRDQPARLRTMRDTIAWSYDLLGTDDQRLFRRLAVFSGGWTLEAVDAICGGDLDVLEGLATLVDQSLVRRVEQPDGSTRFGMLETIREYAGEQLVAGDEAGTIQARHATLYLALAQQHHPHLGPIDEPEGKHTHLLAMRPGIGKDELAAWLGRLEPEQDNIRAALAAFLKADETDAALHLAVAMGRFWFTRGQLSEGSAWLERVLLRGEAAPVYLRARARLYAGVLAGFRGDFPTALAHFQESQSLWRALDDEEGVLESLVALATLAEYQGDEVRSTHLYEEILVRARGRSEELVCIALIQLSDAAYRQGDLDRATVLSEEALVACQDQPTAKMVALCNVAQVAIEHGDHERAARLYAEVLLGSQRWQEPMGIADGLSGFAGVALARGQAEPAARLLGVATATSEQHGWPIMPHEGQYQRALAATRSALSAEAFERAWAEGRDLSVDDAITAALALAEQHSPLTVAPPVPEEIAARHGLTQRELDVLRLIVEGLSDREIAERLFISHRTVGVHVTNILTKLNLESRTAAATWAVRHGLA